MVEHSLYEHESMIHWLDIHIGPWCHPSTITVILDSWESQRLIALQMGHPGLGHRGGCTPLHLRNRASVMPFPMTCWVSRRSVSLIVVKVAQVSILCFAEPWTCSLFALAKPMHVSMWLLVSLILGSLHIILIATIVRYMSGFGGSNADMQATHSACTFCYVERHTKLLMYRSVLHIPRNWAVVSDDVTRDLLMSTYVSHILWLWDVWLPELLIILWLTSLMALNHTTARILAITKLWLPEGWEPTGVKVV